MPLNQANRRSYDDRTEKRILGLLDRDPPEGYSEWSGLCWPKNWATLAMTGVAYIAQAQDSVAASAELVLFQPIPSSGLRPADVVGLYLSPPENAVVLCLDGP